jgi:hypothetical protein
MLMPMTIAAAASTPIIEKDRRRMDQSALR